MMIFVDACNRWCTDWMATEGGAAVELDDDLTPTVPGESMDYSFASLGQSHSKADRVVSTAREVSSACDSLSVVPPLVQLIAEYSTRFISTDCPSQFTVKLG